MIEKEGLFHGQTRCLVQPIRETSLPGGPPYTRRSSYLR
jgi:hypothetical protein